MPWLYAIAQEITRQGPYPAPSSLARVVTAIQDRLGITGDNLASETPAAYNARRLLQLAAREMAQENSDVTRQLIEAVDYVRHTSTTGQTLTANTWKRLMRHSAQWHRDQTQVRLQSAIESLKLKGYHAWTSLLKEFEHEGLTIVPLDDELKLLTEGLTQKHCVGTYTQSALDGACRLFPIRENQKALATTEIRINPKGECHPVQTKGPGNHQPDQRAAEAAAETSRRYQKAASTAQAKPTGPGASQHIATSYPKHISTGPLHYPASS